MTNVIIKCSKNNKFGLEVFTPWLNEFDKSKFQDVFQVRSIHLRSFQQHALQTCTCNPN